MTTNDIIVHSLTVSHIVLQRYTSDLTPAEYLHRPTPKANCAAWLIGHLALSDRSVLERLGVKDLPELPDGFASRFSRDEGNNAFLITGNGREIRVHRWSPSPGMAESPLRIQL